MWSQIVQIYPVKIEKQKPIDATKIAYISEIDKWVLTTT